MVKFESPDTLPPQRFELGRESELEVRSKRQRDKSLGLIVEHEIVVRNPRNREGFNLAMLLGPEDRFLQEGFRHPTKVESGTKVDVPVPKFPREKTLVNGRNTLLSVLHEIGRLKAGPVTGTLLQRAQDSTSSSNSISQVNPQAAYTNAALFEFAALAQNERKSWAYALTNARELSKTVGDDVLHAPGAKNVTSLVHDAARASYLSLAQKLLGPLLKAGYTLDHIQKNLMENPSINAKIALFERIHKSGLENYGLELNRMIYNMRKLDPRRITPLLDEDDKIVAKRLPDDENVVQRIAVADAINNLIPQ